MTNIEKSSLLPSIDSFHYDIPLTSTPKRSTKCYYQQQQPLSSTLNSGPTSTSWLNSLIGNLMILALLAVFAIVVRFILNSTAEIQ